MAATFVGELDHNADFLKKKKNKNKNLKTDIRRNGCFAFGNRYDDEISCSARFYENPVQAYKGILFTDKRFQKNFRPPSVIRLCAEYFKRHSGIQQDVYYTKLLQWQSVTFSFV